MSEFVARKVGMKVQVSPEVLVEIVEDRAVEAAWRALSPAEREARTRTWRAAQDVRRAANVAAYAAVMEAVGSARSWIVPTTAGDALARLGARHCPDPGNALNCAVQHEGGYEWEPGEWPCEDFADVAAAVGVEVPGV